MRPRPVDLDYIHALRNHELDSWLNHAKLEKNQALLEIGAGTGAQSLALSKYFTHVTAIDMASSVYAQDRVFPVQNYNGQLLPFAEASFDIVYSSHVLEHVAHLSLLSDEIRRVLKPGGIVVHVLPSPAWRIGTSITHYLALPGVLMTRAATHGGDAAPGATKPMLSNLLSLLFAPRHGERGNRFTEAWFFRTAWWQQKFSKTGWRVTDTFALGVFYTGNIILGARLSLTARSLLARIFGSASYCYTMRGE